ncbi:hypothetical protein A176_004206 [Myxococcus hansupus]|uniref:Uncharacterized protein n=1 Tax=Pseudomyxococcus hansupus TaxID=1297742 RepID=A0A0H4WWV5_9BACT|nr:hypothetical protein A176_004206 [Myxococcus hansupus]
MAQTASGVAGQIGAQHGGSLLSRRAVGIGAHGVLPGENMRRLLGDGCPSRSATSRGRRAVNRPRARA